MRPGFCPVFPRMAAGVETDELLIPVQRRAVVVVPLQTGTIVDSLITEQRAKSIDPVGAGDQAVEIIMSALMAKMSEQGPIWFGHLFAHFFTIGGIGLGNVDGDDAFRMTGQDSFTVRHILQKLKRQA